MRSPLARMASPRPPERPLVPPDPVPADAELRAIRAGLRRQRGRLWLRRAARRAASALAVVLVAEAVLLAVARLVPLEAAPTLAVAIPAGGLVALLIVVIGSRPSLGETALAMDAEAALADRLGSALAFAVELPGAGDPGGPDAVARAAFVARQRRDALDVLAGVPAGMFRPRVATRPALVALVAAALLVPLVLVDNPMDRQVARDRAIREEATQTAERIDRLAEQLEKQGRNPGDPRTRLASDLRDLAGSLRDDPGALDGHLARLGGVEAAVREQLDPSNEERAAALASLSRGLSRATTGDAKANPGGDPAEAQGDLDRLAAELGDRAPAELARLGQSLAALQGAASQTGSGADGALRDATSALARADRAAAAEALRRLGDTLRGAEDRVATNRDLSGAAAQLQDARRRLADAGRPGGQVAGNPGQPGQGPGQGSQPGASGNPGQGQGQPGASGNPGQGQGQGQGQGSIGGGGSNARYLGTGTGSGTARGPVNPNRPAGEPGDQSSVYAPFDRLGRPGDPTYVAGTGGDGGQVQPGSGTGTGSSNPALVPYADVFSDFYRYAQTTLERSYVPIAVKDLVRDYFSALDPTGQETK